MTAIRPDLDVLFITGDFVAHKMNNRRGKPYENHRYETVMGVHRSLAQIMAKEMPTTRIIPTFGNNDFDLDDEPANDTTKVDFY